ncbi:MAG: ribonucleoside triphosphate reductase [Nanoarchaeota archaeon]|nr:ribonucleoside triphosphate reductase [Nanoarchaeota archaeon]
MSISRIKKRNGTLADFKQEKITEAVLKAIQAVHPDGDENRRAAERVSDRVVADLGVRFGTEGSSFYPTVEQTQDMVETTLMRSGHEDVAKAFILYRENHTKARESRGFEADLEVYLNRMIGGYMGDEDWQVRENANVGAITFQGLAAHISGEVLKKWGLGKYRERDPRIEEFHKKGKMHIHDLAYAPIAYCAGWSLDDLLRRGFGEVPDRVQSSPPKHLGTVINQMVNFTGTMQAEFAGAQAFSSVDTRLAPFVRADGLDFKGVKQNMQSLIYGLNVPSRWGWQAPFSNLTFDLIIPEDLRDQRAVIGGEEIDSTYGEYQEEADMINRAFLEVMRKGDKNGRIFTFPIPTYNLTRDFDWDNETADLLFEVTGKYGTPYFQNYVGSDLDPASIRAMCCRLNLDQSELMKRPGNIWGPGDSTGSVGVVTINMNRLGYEAQTEDEFFNQLGEIMEVAKISLETKREIVDKMLENDFMPYTKSYLGHFDNHFSTIGLCGMHEACLNHLGEGIGTEEGRDFTIRTLNFMREKVRQFQEETGHLYNLEATPAESTSYRLAKSDKETYPNIRTSGNGTPFLTNSTQLNVGATTDVVEALEHQDRIQPLYTGGTIFHTFIPEAIDGPSAKRLVRKIAENTHLPYFSITPTFSICQDHGYLNGEQEACPNCGGDTEIYSRIVGYYRPLTNWNPGKRAEFRERTPYVEGTK